MNEKKKHFLQKIARVVSYLSSVTAVGLMIYLVTIYDTEEIVLKSSIGAAAFFFFMVGLVLHIISDTNLPDLKIKR